MDVALFPDGRRVLLVAETAAGERPEARAGATDRGNRLVLPRHAALKRHGYDGGDDPWSGHPIAGAQVLGSVVGRDTTARLAAEMPGATVVTRRAAAGLMDMDAFWRMNRAYHLAEWDRTSRFCGVCGAPMALHPTEIAKRCTACTNTVYPRISPAAIMAVVRDGKLLLAHNHRHGGHIFSVLAGFVEPGETLEETVIREVAEESGISVRNVRYFASQPWPFPNSLMVAFTADYAGGELRPEPEEIDEIGWFAPDALPPELPTTFSVARRLIEWFVSAYGTPADLRRLLSNP